MNASKLCRVRIHARHFENLILQAFICSDLLDQKNEFMLMNRCDIDSALLRRFERRIEGIKAINGMENTKNELILI